MTWRGYLLVLAVISMVAGGWWAFNRATTPPTPFPSSVLSVVQNAERVRVQRMKPLVGSPPAGAAYLENCNVVGTGKAIDPPPGWLSDLSGILTDGRTYGPSVSTGVPTPKIVIRFVRGETKVDVMLDFDYDTVVVQSDGKPCGTGVFTSRRADLLRLAKVLFPDDSEIQAIASTPEGGVL